MSKTSAPSLHKGVLTLNTQEMWCTCFICVWTALLSEKLYLNNNKRQENGLS